MSLHNFIYPISYHEPPPLNKPNILLTLLLLSINNNSYNNYNLTIIHHTLYRTLRP